MAAWSDIYKLFTYAFTKNALERRGEKYLTGAGTRQPEAIPDIRADGSYWGGGRGVVRLRESNDFLDLSTVVNRAARYKEYERLRNIPEVEMVMTTFADEACFVGDTLIPMPLYGFKTLQWLAENKKDEKFLVYCWDFKKNDYTLGWGYDPRKTKEDFTVKIVLDDGSYFICTPDHRILLRENGWIAAGDLKFGTELMPFYHLPANQYLTKSKKAQFPRVFTFSKGWMHERQFIDEWRSNKEDEELQRVNKIGRLLKQGLNGRQVAKLVGRDPLACRKMLSRNGFSVPEFQWLGKKPDRRRVIGVFPHHKLPVYDLSVQDHKNFCTSWGVAHNCQRGENSQVFEINVKNQEIKEELEFLFFHRKMLNFNQRRLWNIVKDVCIFGDWFGEIILDPDNPKDGILGIMDLPAESIYRIETTKGKLIEFQQAREGPDYQSLARVEVTKATDAELQQATAIRFAPEQIVHLRIGEDRKTFYPYGVSLMEPARGPAHQLRLMEDAMVTYRLCLIGSTRIRTPEGYKYLKDIQVGDIVYTLKGKKLKPVEVTSFMKTGIQQTFAVKSKHVEITGNASHPILVIRNGKPQYVEIKDLKIKKDKLLPMPRLETEEIKIPRIIGEKWAKLSEELRSDFRRKDYKNKAVLLQECHHANRAGQFLYMKNKALPYEHAKRICQIFGLDDKKLIILNKGEINSQRINLPNYVDEEFARLFGFICGNGTVSNNSISFSTSPSEECNQYYKNLLEKYFSKVSFSKDKRSKCSHKFIVNSTFAANLFREMGYIHNHKKTRIPAWVFKTKLEIRKAFIQGLSDANGCERFTKKGTWFSTIELSNKKLIEDIKELWSSIGLSSGHIKKRKMPSTVSYSVTISELLLPKAENVLSVKKAKKEQVYDITVKADEHNFIANGIPVHNSRAPERRVFYIDVGQVPSYKQEAFMERLKDQLRKKKVSSNRFPDMGASSVEERWSAPTADEDFWIPIRPNTNTRIETLPGAENLGEIDDTVYFRNKLFMALNFPQNYFNQTDAQQTRISLSAQDVKFARLIERIQSYVEDDLLWHIADRHLRLRGYPETMYEDLFLKMTPPSEWREASRQDILTNRITNITSLKGSNIMADFDLLTRYGKFTEDEAEEIVARNEIQKLKDLRYQIIAQNPQIAGLGMPGAEGEEEIGTDGSGPNPMLGGGMTPDMTGMGMPPNPAGASPAAGGFPPAAGGTPPSLVSGRGKDYEQETTISFGEPDPEDVKKYDLDIQDYSQEMDQEDIDYSELISDS